MPTRNALTLENQRELHAQVLHAVPTDIGVEVYNYWMSHGSELNTTLRAALGNIPQSAVPKLLELVKTVPLPAIPAFSAEDHFKVGTTGEVAIRWIDNSFRNAFLVGKGKVEMDVLEATLRIHRLCKSSVDGPIITELGDKAETSLGLMWEMMKKQGHGQRGVLLTNGYANVFYVPDARGTLWAVYCRWNVDGGAWRVYASSITSPSSWNAGRQVVSR